ncbi:hypothetical protein GGI20_004888, partial [Coemansia sp. BCRC 34301]
MSTLKSLPALTRLYCDVANLGSQLDHLSEDEMPDFVASTYVNAGKCLKFWRLAPIGPERIGNVTKLV